MSMAPEIVNENGWKTCSVCHKQLSTNDPCHTFTDCIEWLKYVSSPEITDVFKDGEMPVVDLEVGQLCITLTFKDEASYENFRSKLLPYSEIE